MQLEFHQLALKYDGLRISKRGLQARLIASLAEEGQLHPVMVVPGEGSSARSYVLIDGYRRVSALRSMGRDTVESLLLPLCETAALIFRHCQESVRPRTALEDGWLLRELLDAHGMNQAELSRRLQRSESWVSRRLSLVRELPESAQELVRKGKLCGHGAMKYLVPLARAKRSDCETLVHHLSLRRTSTRELERVYMSWKSGDAERRRRVVAAPQLFLKAAAEVRSAGPQKSVDEIQQMIADIEILDAVSGRGRRRIRGMKADTPLPSLMIESWRAAQSSFLALTQAMEKRINAGSRDTGRDFAPQG
jgi:ParB family transcriptional regulator, chromosome partitioning protein